MLNYVFLTGILIFAISSAYFLLAGKNKAGLNSAFLVSFITYLAVRLTAQFVFIYGRRRLVLSILLGFIFGYILRNYIAGEIYELADVRLEAIGYIIPGLIANWMERQGIFRTISAVAIASVVVRLAVMIIGGGRILA